MKTFVLTFVLLFTIPLLSVFSQDIEDVANLKETPLFTTHFVNAVNVSEEKSYLSNKVPKQYPSKNIDKLYAGSTSKLFSITPYIKIGYLMAAPNANDLGYISADGENLDQYLDMGKNNFGGGVQIFYNMNPAFKLGIDIGYQKLFSSTYDLGNAAIDSRINYDYFTENEQDLYILALTEFSLYNGSIPVYIQPGIGLHMVFYQYHYNFSSINSSNYDESIGTEFHPGLTAIIGTRLPIGNFEMPLFLKFNHIFMYGATIAASIGAGLTF